VNTGTVLHIHFVAHLYKIYVATDNRIEPKATIITGNHITDYSGIGSNKTIVTELRMFIFYGEYYSHMYFFCLPAEAKRRYGYRL
jgi:hypothetical protein